ncbi:MAG: hypothetical protein MPW15_08080 [Candidatus Manganitrophus sp.]|nr:hypothetical protein [Candidatus Manganitrophus sp.]
MAMYCLNLMRIALELAAQDRVYEDIATKFFEHFLHIAEAMTTGWAAGRPAFGTRRTGSTTTSSTPAGRPRRAAAGPLDGGAHPALRHHPCWSRINANISPAF